MDNDLNVSNLGCALMISSLCRYLGVITHFRGGGRSGARADVRAHSDDRPGIFRRIQIASGAGENGMLAARAFGMWRCDVHHTLSRRDAHAL